MFARTQRLTLRPGWPEDARAVTDAIAHEDVAMKLARLPWPYRLEHAEGWLSAPRATSDAVLLILAHEGSHQPRLIGCIGVERDGEAHELGYWLTPDAWGRGYATEAGHAALGIARHAMGLKRLSSGYFLDNPASGRVLRKLGFRQTGTTQRHSLARGHDAPCAVMELDLEDAGRMPLAAAA